MKQSSLFHYTAVAPAPLYNARIYNAHIIPTQTFQIPVNLLDWMGNEEKY